MLKKHGRLLSGALATALTVANMGALMPMTAFAAVPTSDDSGLEWTLPTGTIYTGQPFKVQLDWTANLDPNENDAVQIYLNDAGDTDLHTGSMGEANTAVNTLQTSNITAASAGRLKFQAQTKTGGAEYAPIADFAEASLTIEEAKITALTASANYAQVATNGGLLVSATESFNYFGAAEDIEWEVYDAEAYAEDPLTAQPEAAFTFDDGVYTPPTSGTSYSENEVPLTVTGATEGNYTIVAKAGSVVKTLPLEVVDLTSYSVLITDGAYSGNQNQVGELYPEDTLQLTAYVNRSKNTNVTWISSDEEVATVNGGKVTGIAPGNANITATYKVGDNLIVEDTFAVTISPASYQLIYDEDEEVAVGDTAEIVAMYGSKDVSALATWKSYNTSVATVSGGTITAISEGTAVIRATYKGQFLEKVITVVDAEEPVPTPVSYGIIGKDGVAVLHPGNELQMVIYADDEEYKGSATWSVSGLAGTTINSKGVLKAGTTTGDVIVTALFDADNDGEYEDVLPATVTIRAEDVSWWDVTEDGNHNLAGTEVTYTANMYVNDYMTITAKYNDEAVVGTWSSSDQTVARVSSKGVITALSEGPATITFVSDVDGDGDTNEAYETVTITVTVEDADLILSSDSDEVEVGTSLQLTAMYGIDDVTSDNDIEWESDNESVATVDAKGLVTGLEEGQTTITATYNNTPATLVIEVIAVTEATTKVNEAANNANEAAVKANAAAQKAIEAAKNADANPSAETVAEAKKASEDATAAAQAATAAAKAAEEALENEDANANALKAAEEAAQAASTAAQAATNAATTAADAATAAQAKVDEAAKKSDGSTPGTPAAAGTELKDGTTGATTGYVVTNATAGSAEVQFKGSEAAKAAKSFTIPDTVKDSSGNEYKVTSIAANAFAGMDAKTVTIGKNITKIDKNAFANSNVKKVNVKGTKITKAMKKAFNKLKKGSTIKVSGKNKKANKKLLNSLKNVKNGKIKVK